MMKTPSSHRPNRARAERLLRAIRGLTRNENPNHDEKGRFSEGGGGGGGESGGGGDKGGDHDEKAEGLSEAAATVQSDINDHAADVDTLSDELTDAISEYNDVAGELEPGEEYESAADQKDFEDRLGAAEVAAAKASDKLRDKLEAMIRSAQSRIEKLDDARLKAPF